MAGGSRQSTRTIPSCCGMFGASSRGPSFHRTVQGADSAGWAKVWASLADNDAKAAFTAIRLLAAFPKESLQLLSEKGRVAHPDATRLAKLIEQLGAEEFADREIATQALAALGSVARPALVEAAASSPSAEIRDRAAQLLARETKNLTSDELRIVRVVEAVEWIGTADALELLNCWASGPVTTRLSSEAKASLARLQRARAVAKGMDRE